MSDIYYSAAVRGFFHSAIHGKSIPGDAVEIAAADHAALMAAQAAGQIIQPDADGYPVAVAPPAPTLAEVQASAAAQVDADAEAARLRFVTPGAAQAMVYRAKADEARALQAEVAGGGTPAASDYPHLAAEVDVTAATLEGVADVVLAKEAEWVLVSAAIEGMRQRAKRDIAEASMTSAVQAVLDRLVWPELV